MKKEYHYTISRTDRIYLISFVVILLGWELIKHFMPSGEKSFTYISPPSEHSGFKQSNFRFQGAGGKHETNSPFFRGLGGKREINSPWSKYQGAGDKSEFKTTKQYSSYEEEQEQSPPSSPLHISTASVDELTSMGVSRKVAYHIQKFISAGGHITNEKDLLKIYGMDSLQLTNALPYIIFDTISKKNNPDLEKILPDKPVSKNVDLNQASTEDLESLDGIGTVFAERIIKFRDALGGFLSVDQLKDCYGLPPETLEKIKDHLIVSGSPQLLLINEVNLDSIKTPYLSKKYIRLIKAYKKQHGFFPDASSFRKVYPPDSNWCNKILPYINFGTEGDDH